ncbi:MAG: hypothetical protein ABJA10_06430, partial [Aestuariivirga sp.]
AIVGMDAHLNSQTPIPALLELVRPYIGVSRSLHVRQSTCAKLLNDSFFVGSSDAQFILRMTAIEVLCEKVDHNEKHRKAIDQLIDHLDTLDIELESKADLAKTLGHAKSNGIRTSIRSACKRLLSQTETDRVLKLYDLRSEFVHYGHNRGQFAAESGEALELATKLLKSDLENSSAPI